MPRLTLRTSATATTTPPSAATDGKPLFRGDPNQVAGEGFDSLNLQDVMVLVDSTAGSAVMTVTVRLWGYYAPTGKWYPLGPTPPAGADTLRGLLNNGVAIGELAAPADLIRFAQPFGYLTNFSRIDAEIQAIGGTATAITVTLEAR